MAAIDPDDRIIASATMGEIAAAIAICLKDGGVPMSRPMEKLLGSHQMAICHNATEFKPLKEAVFADHRVEVLARGISLILYNGVAAFIVVARRRLSGVISTLHHVQCVGDPSWSGYYICRTDRHVFRMNEPMPGDLFVARRSPFSTLSDSMLDIAEHHTNLTQVIGAELIMHNIIDIHL